RRRSVRTAAADAGAGSAGCGEGCLFTRGRLAAVPRCGFGRTGLKAPLSIGHLTDGTHIGHTRCPQGDTMSRLRLMVRAMKRVRLPRITGIGMRGIRLARRDDIGIQRKIMVALVLMAVPTVGASVAVVALGTTAAQDTQAMADSQRDVLQPVSNLRTLYA